jgi:hypothetical protein
MKKPSWACKQAERNRRSISKKELVTLSSGPGPSFSFAKLKLFFLFFLQPTSEV